MAGKLYGQVAGEAVRALDDDGADTVAGDAVQHGDEAGARGDGVGAFDGRVIEPIDNDVAGGLGVALNRRALPRLAVLIAPKSNHLRWTDAAEYIAFSCTFATTLHFICAD